MRLLLLSNSTNPGEGYLEYAKPLIEDFLGKGKFKILFIPYAAVSFSYDLYYSKVKEKFNEMGYSIESIHFSPEPEKSINECDCLVIGGGNTFQLLRQLQIKKLLEIIAFRIGKGLPYIGWSAGINLACPTICTSNDMPIVETEGLKALNIIPFQINPHFTEKLIEGHGGESREVRIEEFLHLNPGKIVLGLREGSALRFEGEKIKLEGKNTARLFRYASSPIEMGVEESLDFLLTNPPM